MMKTMKLELQAEMTRKLRGTKSDSRSPPRQRNVQPDIQRVNQVIEQMERKFHIQEERVESLEGKGKMRALEAKVDTNTGNIDHIMSTLQNLEAGVQNAWEQR